MREQPRTNEQRSSQSPRKNVEHDRQNERAKPAEKKQSKNPDRHRNNRVEHDGSDYVL